MRAEFIAVVVLLCLAMPGCGEKPSSSNLASATKVDAAPVPKDPADQKLLDQAQKDIAAHPLIQKYRLDVKLMKAENGYVELLLHHNSRILKLLLDSSKFYSEDEYVACKQLEGAISKNPECKGVFWVLPSVTMEMLSNPERILEVVHRLADKTQSDVLLTKIALVHVNAKDFPSALKVAGTIIDEGSRAEVATAIAVSRNELSEALLKARSIRGTDAKALAFAAIAQAQAKAGDLGAARRTLQEFRQTIRTIQGSDDHTWNFQTWQLRGIAEAQARLKDHRMARETLEEALKIPGYGGKDFKAWALVGLARAQNQVGEKEEARTTLQEAIEAARSINERATKVSVLAQISAAQADTGDMPAARTSLKETLEIMRLITSWSDVTEAANALKDITVAHAHAGDIAAALETFRSLDRPFAPREIQVTALQEIAIAQVKAGQVEEAFGTVRGVNGEWADKATVLYSIAVADRMTQDARLRAYQEFVRLGDAEEDPFGRRRIYELLADAVVDTQRKNRK